MDYGEYKFARFVAGYIDWNLFNGTVFTELGEYVVDSNLRERGGEQKISTVNDVFVRKSVILGYF